MLILGGYRVVRVYEGNPIAENGTRYNELPDTSDPATLGCILALVREHFPGCHAEPNGAPECDSDDEAERAHWWAVYAYNPHRRLSTGATEAEALISALESAP